MADLSLSAAAPNASELIRRGIESRLHLGAQVYVSLNGRPVIDDAVGEAATGKPLTPEHLVPWRSAGKPITAAAILKLCKAGRLSIDQPVAEIIPRYASGGKAHITLQHLLTHTVLLAPAPTDEFAISQMSARPAWDDVIHSICDTPLRSGWNVETQAAYEPTRSWFVLGEVLRVVDGRPFADIVRDDWLTPLGMQHAATFVDRRLLIDKSERIAPLYNRTPRGMEPITTRPADFPSPGASFLGPMRELGRFYEMLLMNGKTNGTQILAPDTVAAMTKRRRIGRFDETFRHIIDFGLGVICDSNQYGLDTVPYGFGRHCSPRAFGHGGAQMAIAFADSEHGLVAAVAFNSTPGEPAHQRRVREFLSQLYVDLGLVRGA